MMEAIGLQGHIGRLLHWAGAQPLHTSRFPANESFGIYGQLTVYPLLSDWGGYAGQSCGNIQRMGHHQGSFGDDNDGADLQMDNLLLHSKDIWTERGGTATDIRTGAAHRLEPHWLRCWWVTALCWPTVNGC